MSSINSESNQQLLQATHSLGKSSEQTTLTVQKIKAINETLVEITHRQYDVVNAVYADGKLINSKMHQSVSLVDESLVELNKTIDNIDKEVTRIEGSMKLFDRIEEGTESLYKVARYTKMLALNTAVLGGATGNANNGVNIVAQEMQELVKACEAASGHIDTVVSQTRDCLLEIISDNKLQIQSGKENTAKVELALQNLVNLFQNPDTAKVGADEIENQEASIDKIIESVGDLEKLAQNLMGIAEETKSETQVLNNEVEVSNQALSDVIGIVTNTPITNVKPKHVVNELQNFRIIDVRRVDEFNDNLGHINSAKLLPIVDTSFKNKLSRLNPSKTYLFVCRSGGRSSRAARIAQSLGFSQIFNLEGGMLAWDKLGLPVTRDT